MDRLFLANCYLEFHFGDRSEGVLALVSEFGVMRVNFVETPHNSVVSMAGKPIKIRLGVDMELQGMIVKESTPMGTYFSVRFLDVSEEIRQELRKSIELQQFPAPWLRNDDRFHIEQMPSFVETPAIAVVSDVQSSKKGLQIIDFSEGGLSVVSSGMNPLELSLKEEVKLELRTNQDTRLKDVKGKVVRVTEDFDPVKNERILRYGIVIEELHDLDSKKYRYLLEVARDQKREKDEKKLRIAA